MNELQPIKTAPMDGTAILVATEKGFTTIADWSGFPRFWYLPEAGGLRLYDFTHWMPLPPPPLSSTTEKNRRA